MEHSNFFRFVPVGKSLQTLEEGGRGGEYQAKSLCIYLGENCFGQRQPTSMLLDVH